MKIWILRGLPGTGKSKWVKDEFGLDESRAEVFSADNWHMFNGVYKFDPKRSGYAHDECFRAYMMAAQMEKGKEALVVDNTNTTLMELAPYVRVAQCLHIDYEILYFPCSVETALKRNTHGVPFNTILQMQKNLLTEIVPPYWNQTCYRGE